MKVENEIQVRNRRNKKLSNAIVSLYSSSIMESFIKFVSIQETLRRDERQTHKKYILLLQ
jgi:hypothetical protein